ncbi:MAG: glycogen/starch synthase, partial [bacterium]
MGSPLSIVHLASEMAPFAKVGGLGDVVAALAREQVRRGHRVVVALPRYRDLVLPAGWRLTELDGTLVPWGVGHEPARFAIAEGPLDQPTVLLVEHAGDRRFFARAGFYDDPVTHEGYPDNPERFLFFTRAALEAVK